MWAPLARVILAALGRWAPRLVGAGLKALGVIEAAQLLQQGYAEVFGSAERQAEAAAGAGSPEEAPEELIEFMRARLAVPIEDRRCAVRDLDPIIEEEILAGIDRAERRDPAADIAIQIL